MHKFILRQLVGVLPILIFVTILVFLLINLAPGDAAVKAAGGFEASPEAVVRARERLGLDDPFFVQYWRWAEGVVLRGDLGRSYIQGLDVADMIGSRLPVTLALTVGAMIVGLLISIPAGIIAAVRSGGILDKVITGGTSLGIAIPNFALALAFVLVFALVLRWFPATGYVSASDDTTLWMRHLVLPWFAMGLALAAELTRFLRASLRDVLIQDYVRTAKGKGLRAHKVVLKHALRNAAIPVVTVVGLQLRNLFGSTVVIERVFNIHGVGDLTAGAVVDRDLPVIAGIAFVTVLVVLLLNLFVDLSYGFLNPRIRSSLT